MMKEVVLFYTLIVMTSAAVQWMHLQRKPYKFKDEPGCYLPELDCVVPFGEAIRGTTGCSEYLCKDNYVVVLTCGVYEGEHCNLVQDLSLPYPQCCPQPDPECTDNSMNSIDLE